MLVGFLLTPFMSVPLATLVLLFHREFANFFLTLLATVLTVGLFFVGNVLSEST